MKYCPLCNKDLEDDQNLCPECGGELLNGSSEDNVILLEHEKEETILKLFNYLREHGFEKTQYYNNQKHLTYVLVTDAAEERKTRESLLYYLENSDFSDREDIQEQLSIGLQSLFPDEGGKTFVKAKDRYHDMMSSATSLIFVGVLGFVLIALIYLDVIKLNMNILFYILSSCMFGGFLILGIISFAKSLKIKSSISQEKDLSEEIKKFLLEYYENASDSDSLSDLSEEEKYFSRTADMKERILSQFPDADALMADAMIEEVYERIYTKQSEEN